MNVLKQFMKPVKKGDTNNNKNNNSSNGNSSNSSSEEKEKVENKDEDAIALLTKHIANNSHRDLLDDMWSRSPTSISGQDDPYMYDVEAAASGGGSSNIAEKQEDAVQQQQQCDDDDNNNNSGRSGSGTVVRRRRSLVHQLQDSIEFSSKRDLSYTTTGTYDSMSARDSLYNNRSLLLESERSQYDYDYNQHYNSEVFKHKDKTYYCDPQSGMEGYKNAAHNTIMMKRNQKGEEGHPLGGRRLSRVDLPRMVQRNLPFNQSSNHVSVKNKHRSKPLWQLMFLDWFHTLLRLPACVSVGFLLLLWVLIVFMFGCMYWYLDNVALRSLDCGLGVDALHDISFLGAIAFSLETCTTVGYGLPGSSNAFFEQECIPLQVTIFFEMITSMMFNAFLFSFFYSLFSKSEYRSSQIIFTNKLLINVDMKSDKAYARLQCYDIDSAHPLVEAHARMYVLDHKLKMHPLRLADPNDDLGGVLYPSVPADIVHVIDHHSILTPRKYPFIESSNGLTLRSIDSFTGNRDEVICPVCGEAYGTFKRLRKHIEYNAMIETTDPNIPKDKSHIGFVCPTIEPLSLEEIQDHIAHTLSEIVVVVEAIDPQLSGTFQSLQSYKYEDIVFGAEFASCMGSEEGRFTVDMKRFHKVRKFHKNLSKNRTVEKSLSLKVDRISNTINNTNNNSNKINQTPIKNKDKKKKSKKAERRKTKFFELIDSPKLNFIRSRKQQQDDEDNDGVSNNNKTVGLSRISEGSERDESGYQSNFYESTDDSDKSRHSLFGGFEEQVHHNVNDKDDNIGDDDDRHESSDHDNDYENDSDDDEIDTNDDDNNNEDDEDEDEDEDDSKYFRRSYSTFDASSRALIPSRANNTTRLPLA